MAKNDSINPVNIHVGSQIRTRRTLLGLSQSALGEAIGVTFQSIQKYERGACRVSASGLWQLGEALGVHPKFFFEGLSGPLPEGPEEDQLHRRDTLELVRNFHRIPDAETRRKVYSLVKTIADAQHPVAA